MSFWAWLISLSGPDLEIVTVNYNPGLGSSFSPWCIYVSDFPFLNLFCLRLLSKGHLTIWPGVCFLVSKMRQLGYVSLCVSAQGDRAGHGQAWSKGSDDSPCSVGKVCCLPTFQNDPELHVGYPNYPRNLLHAPAFLSRGRLLTQNPFPVTLLLPSPPIAPRTLFLQPRGLALQIPLTSEGSPSGPAPPRPVLGCIGASFGLESTTKP